MVVCTFPMEPSSGDAVIEQEERRAATVERRLMRVGGEVGRDCYTRRLCLRLSERAPFIPTLPSELSHAKAPLTPDSDPFRLRGAYSPHMFVSVRLFCFD